MTADIEAIRARIANVQPFVGFGFATSQITMETADVEALCDEVEELDARREIQDTTIEWQASRLFESGMSGRKLGHQLAREINRRKLAEERYEIACRIWREQLKQATLAQSEELASCEAGLYELRQQQREADQ